MVQRGSMPTPGSTEPLAGSDPTPAAAVAVGLHTTAPSSCPRDVPGVAARGAPPRSFPGVPSWRPQRHTPRRDRREPANVRAPPHTPGQLFALRESRSRLRLIRVLLAT